MDIADLADPVIAARLADAVTHAHHDLHPVAQRRNAAGAIICADCGEPLPAGRLRACPAAGRCVECQVISEVMR